MQNRLAVIIFKSFGITPFMENCSNKRQQSFYLAVKLGKNQSYITDNFNFANSSKEITIKCHSDNDELQNMMTSFQLPHSTQFHRNIQDQYFIFEIWGYDSRKVLATNKIHLNLLKDNSSYSFTLQGQNCCFKILANYEKEIASSSSQPRISPYHTNFFTQNTPTNGRGLSLNNTGKPQYLYTNPEQKHRKQIQRNSSDNLIVPSLRKVDSCNLKKQQKSLLLNFRDLTQRSGMNKNIDQEKYESHRDSVKKYSYKLIPQYHLMGRDNLNTTKKISIKNRNMPLPTYKKINDSYNQLKL